MFNQTETGGKNHNLIARSRLTSTQDPLDIAICTAGNCTAVSHLSCLATAFNAGSVDTIIPRGGTCSSCGQYTTWGDIIKGVYRRKAGRAVTQEDEDLDESESSEDELDGSGLRRIPKGPKRTAEISPKKAPRRIIASKTSSSRPKPGTSLVSASRVKAAKPRVGVPQSQPYTLDAGSDGEENFERMMMEINSITSNEEGGLSEHLEGMALR